MHRLLKRQIKKIFGDESRLPEGIRPLLSAIDEAYTQDMDRAMLERSLDISSDEMRASYNELQRLHAELESRIQQRTAELLDANASLQTEIVERRQIEIMQEAVYRIAQAAEEIESLNSLYPKIHQIISSVMPAEIFYIALYDRENDELSFAYYVDGADAASPGKIRPGRGISAYVLRTGEALLCDRAVYEELERRGEVELLGPPASIWLGVPLIIHSQPIGIMAVQHYSNPNAYSEAEQRILEFVSSQVARVKALLRRNERKSNPATPDVQVGDLMIDPAAHREVRMGELLVSLRAQEYDLLLVFVENRGIVLSREKLLELAGGFDYYGQTRTVDVHVSHLRRKLSGSSVRIETVAGVGYKLVN